MNKNELIDSMAAEAGMTKADAGKALDAFITSVTAALKKGDEIRGLVREIENRVEAGILPDGNYIFDPLRVRLALELVLSVLEQGTPVKTAKSPAKTAESN